MIPFRIYIHTNKDKYPSCLEDFLIYGENLIDIDGYIIQIKIFGALSGLMLDLALLKII